MRPRAAPDDRAAAPAAERAPRLRGEVDLGPLARRLYSQDASIYEERPLGVACPRDAADCAALVRWAAAGGVPLVPRGGGTSLAGQVVGAGLVVDFSRHMNRVASVDAAAGRARVGPGVVQDDLNDAVAPEGLQFAPDTSTSRQATIGGMVGNNSCGAYSVLHGTTREHVLALDVVLADGSAARLGPLAPAELAAKRALPTLEGAAYRAACDAIDRGRDAVLAAYPSPAVRRRNMGYALDELARGQPWDPAGPPFNLAALVCGSEGTLALVTEAEVRLVPRPAQRLLLVAHFASVDEACRATVAAMAHGPAAVEIMDAVVLGATRGNRGQAANRFWIEGEPGAVLAIEWHGETDGALGERAAALAADLRGRGLGYAFPVVPQDRIARVWAVRKAGLGLLTGIPGDAKAVPGIEDASVPLDRLPEYWREMQALLARHDCACACYGHASVGLLHLRPMLNLKDPRDVERFGRILDETADLVKRLGGSFSGEHGDGRLRGPFVRRMLSPEVYDRLVAVKRAFDPRGILNPGKIVDAPPLASCLRLEPGRPTPGVATVFDWSRTLGYVRAAETCNGVGQCRQAAGRGTMCPSYMASGEERHTTRARANVLRQLLAGDDPAAAWTDPGLAEAMDTCLSCKGCATECPSSVDLARLKAEWLQRRNDLLGASPRSRLLGHFAFFARLARVAPRLASAVANLAAVKRALGIAPLRRVPAYAAQTFAGWYRQHREHANAGRRGEVLLLNDEFTHYLEPHVGAAATEVLEAAGYRVRAPLGLESARSQISKGFLRDARRHAERAVAVLAPAAERGTPVLGLEPSALLGLRDEVPDLVSPALREAAGRVRDAARLFDEFLAEAWEAGRVEPLALRPLPRRRILVHGHCHQKALASVQPTLALLRRIPGAEVVEIPSGCCGMAGSFGYEAEHYAMSMQIGELILFPAVRRDAGALVCAPGTSCRQQIADGTGRRAWHPAELLRQSLAGP